MAVTVQAHADDGFATAAAEVLGLPEVHPDRARRAAELITELVRRPLARLFAIPHLDGLLAAAAQRPPATPQWPRIEFLARVQSLMYAVVQGASTELTSVDAKLRAAAVEAAGEPALNALVQSAQLALDMRRAAEWGDEAYLQRLPQKAEEWMASLPDHPGLAGIRDVLSFGAEAMTAHSRGDSTAAWAAFQRLEEVVEALPADAPFRATLRGATAPGAAFRSILGADGSLPPGGVSDEQLAVFAEVLNRPEGDSGLADRGLAELMLDVMRMADMVDADLIDNRVAHLRAELSRRPMEDARRALHQQGIALGLFRRSEVTGTIAGLDEARRLLIETRELLAGPRDPQWTMVNGILAAVEHRLSGGDGVSSAAQAGQRGHAWRAILETYSDGAPIAIRDAATSAVDGARQCLSGGKLAEALRLLDTGRGLMLFAAVEQHRIPGRLRDAERDDLATEWEKPDGTPSAEGRRLALEVLAEQPTDDLFDPPGLASIQQALTLLDADALVYLVPGDPPHGGLAVMAPAAGSPAFMALPNLSLVEGTKSAQYLATLSTRNAREIEPEITPPREIEFTARLVELCDWAWGAAMGPVLESYLPRLTLPDGRVPRIVLIPMGDLARVPWHAARRPDGVYAVELAAISQAVSARLICDNAVKAPVPVGSTGLVVGDPRTGDRARSLASARAEAYAIRESFYRGARYLGRLPAARTTGGERISSSGGGTAEQVRAWLVDRNPAAGTMLHLACHGFFRPEPEPAGYLLLGDGSELKVDELVDVLATAPDRDIALVVLAACNSGRAVYGYDEAYSLGTGFLAGGVRSVLSTQWSVPDTATSWLMYLFHHNVRALGMPPWQALRQAQLWMLDPARTPPPGMPAELVPGPGDQPEEPVNWAGFVHYGQ